MTKPLDIVIEALQKAGREPQRHNGYWQARCPGRDDTHPSLSISEGNDGRVLLYDHGRKATAQQIIESIGLGWGDTFADNPRPPTLDKPKLIATYDYPDASGQPYRRVLRYSDHTFKQQGWNGNEWLWKVKDRPPVIYNLPDVVSNDGPVCFTEGEKDANKLAALGFIATTNPGGAGKATQDALRVLTGRDVIIFEDNDESGRLHVQKTGELLRGIAASIRVVTPQNAGYAHIKKGDISDKLETITDDKGQFVQGLIENAPHWKHTEPVSVLDLPDDTDRVFMPLSLTELLQRPPKEWLIDDFLGRADLAMVFGDAGSGKTFVTLAAMVEAATGRPVADQFNVSRPLSVFYAAGEGIAGLPGRFTAALNKYHLRPDEINITIFTDVPQLFETSAQANIYTFVDELKAAGQRPDLLIIDTMHSAAIGGDENSARDVSVILSSMDYARDALNCTVLLVHHANKTGTYRGSSALHGAMDTMLQTKADSDGYGWLECFKQKDAEGFKKIPFKITGEPVSQSAYVEWGEITEFDNEPTPREKARTAIVELLENEPALTQTAITKKLTEAASRLTVINVLNDLEKRGEVVTNTGVKNSKMYSLNPVV